MTIVAQFGANPVSETVDYIDAYFDHESISSLGLFIGVIPEGRYVSVAIIEILEGFSDGCLFEIGDESAHARLMTVDHCIPQIDGVYENNPNVKYIANSEVFIYLIGDAPIEGAGRVILYLQ